MRRNQSQRSPEQEHSRQKEEYVWRLGGENKTWWFLEQGEGPLQLGEQVGSGGSEVDGGSVHWGCCNKIPLYHRPSDLKTVEINCSQVLKAGSPRSGCQHGRVLVRTHFWAVDCQLLIVSSHSGKQRGKSSFLRTLIRALIPCMEAILMTSSNPNYLSKAPLIVSLHWRVGFQHVNFGMGHKHSVYWLWANSHQPS